MQQDDVSGLMGGEMKFQSTLNELERLKAIRAQQLADRERCTPKDPGERTSNRAIVETLRRDIQEIEEAQKYLAKLGEEGELVL